MEAKNQDSLRRGTQARGGKLSPSGTQDYASPQTPWALCACQPKSRIFRGVRSAGCLAGATPTPATVSQLPGPWLQMGLGMGGGESFSRRSASTSPSHIPVPIYLSSGVTIGQA